MTWLLQLVLAALLLKVSKLTTCSAYDSVSPQASFGALVVNIFDMFYAEITQYIYIYITVDGSMYNISVNTC